MRRMVLIGWIVISGWFCLSSADDKTPSLPKDTLPAKLSVEDIPLGLGRKRPVPEDNALNEAKVQLGRALFFEPLLSVDRTVACASCHNPDHGFANTQPQAVGTGGKRGPRNAPTLLNVAYNASLFWDGRESRLEVQALKPIENPLEMGTSVTEVVKRLQDDPGYRAKFQAVFPDGVTGDNLGKALASFERTLLHGNSKIDRFRAGDAGTLNENERHGLWLFESRGRCWKCHSGSNFTDDDFHNTGVSWGKTPLDLGRFDVTKQETDRGRFKTPTLRGIAKTAPYMHDGSLATLEAVVEFYSRGGGKNPHLDPQLAPLDFDKEEIAGLAAFLRALSE